MKFLTEGPNGYAKYCVELTDKDIIQAYRLVGLKRPDNPSDFGLCLIREQLGDTDGMLSLAWLRNRLVCIRKTGLLKQDSRQA